ncbi:MAG: class II aldolase/adducin family protein [Bacteroidota bacterium]
MNIAKHLIAVCRKVEAKGFITATDGNISARLPNGNILATPTSVNKGFVEIDDLVELDAKGKQLSGKQRPSSEIDMHLFIYRHRHDVTAVVHCHPPYSTGFAVANIALDRFVFPEVIVGFGKIPLAQYATPSTKEVGESLAPFVKEYDAVLLANHGVVTYGSDLWDAYFKMEKVEHVAQMIFIAEKMGGARELTEEQLEKLSAAAVKSYGKDISGKLKR